MNNKKILLLAFILIALAQLFVPAKMIFDSEDVLETGKALKFKTAAVDLNDPFRGTYIMLNYEQGIFVMGNKIENKENWVTGKTIYVTLTADAHGFAKIKSVSRDKPKDSQSFVKAKIAHIDSRSKSKKPAKIIIDYLFERKFYVEESGIYKHKKEQKYQTPPQDVYALIKVKNGQARIENVFINSIPVTKALKKN